jgi:hypothetical protein
MNNFSYSIDIKRFQNLLETSVDDTERQTIQHLLTNEKARRRCKPPNRRRNRSGDRFPNANLISTISSNVMCQYTTLMQNVGLIR